MHPNSLEKVLKEFLPPEGDFSTKSIPVLFKKRRTSLGNIQKCQVDMHYIPEIQHSPEK